MDAPGSSTAVIFGISEGGPMSALFAATNPKRVTRLIMYGTYAKKNMVYRLPMGSYTRTKTNFFGCC
jgi:pimeloyl-ACP methyl ester carboxylesterase